MAAALVAASIGCGTPAREGRDADVGPPDACDGLECRIVDCAKRNLEPTTISGTVFAPNGTLALYGATVYIPNGDPGPLVEGATCSRCEATLPGGSIANALSDPAGGFKLVNVPAGRNVPLVIQIGKWRRQVTIPEVTECTNNVLPPPQTSLPRNKDEGDMPRIAIVTGSCDALECLVKKIGVSPSEFTPDSGTGRVHLYASNGANHLADNTPFAAASTLWGNVDKLKQYDIAMLSCECSQQADAKPQAAMDAMKAYADAGGRLFLSHYHNVWIAGERGVPSHAPAVWPGIATCAADTTSTSTVTIDQVNNPKGVAFASWMLSVMGSTTLGSIPITDGKQTCTSIDNTKAERWVYQQGSGVQYPQNFQFTTPNEAAKEARCGKVVFSDMHVSTGSSSSASTGFPGGCSASAMSPQEKALAFMFFDIASCVGPIF
jgi:hypothetical protein